MKRNTFLIALLVLMLILILIGYFLPSSKPSDSSTTANLTEELATLSSLSPNSNIKTVAICNSSNFCQDYKITCSDGQVVDKQPVEGAYIQHPKDWRDDRNIDYENLCG